MVGAASRDMLTDGTETWVGTSENADMALDVLIGRPDIRTEGLIGVFVPSTSLVYECGISTRGLQ